MAQPELLRRLQEEGWRLKSEPLEALVQEFVDDDGEQGSSRSGPSYSELRAALLDCDLRKYGSGCLPEDVNRASSSSIKGPMVLQVMSVTDVSKPSYASSGSQRLLMLKLHDGRTACKAMEHKHCSNIDETLLPGTKVVLESATVRCGVVLLEPKSLRILGGRVDSLAEAWETQKRYGGTNRPGLAAAAGLAAAGPGPAAPGEAAAQRLTTGAAAQSSSLAADDGASAPRFKQFIPGKDGRRQAQPQQQMAVAAGSNSSSTSIVAAALASSAAQKQKSDLSEPVKRTVDVAPVKLIDAATAKQQSAAQAKLLDKLERSQAEAADRRGRGRGGLRGRRGRRRGHDSDDDDGGGGMTLEEYEARQKSLKAGGVVTTAGLGSAARAGMTSSAADEQLRRDEELARQLQEQLDMEDLQQAGYAAQQQQQRTYDANRGGYSSGRGLGRGATHLPFGQRSQHRGTYQDNVGVDYTSDLVDTFDYGHSGGRGRQGQQYDRGSAGAYSRGGFGAGRSGGRAGDGNSSGGYSSGRGSYGRGGESSSRGGGRRGRGNGGRGAGRGRAY